MRARGFIGALALVCLAATSPPPLPHTPASHYRHAQGVTQGAGAQALIAKIALPPSATLTWRWTPNPGNDWSNVVFVVLTSGNVTAKNWTLAGVAESLTVSNKASRLSVQPSRRPPSARSAARA